MAVLKYRSNDGTIKTLGVNNSGVVTSVNGKTGAVTGLYSADNKPPYPVSSVNGKTGNVTGLYSSDNPPPYPVSSVNGKTGAITGLYSADNPPPETVKVAIVTTEPFGGDKRHRFLKSSLPNLNTDLISREAILSVVTSYDVPMITYGFEYSGDYVVVSLTLINGEPVDNPQTLTILYR